ncbi:Zn-dependent protease [Oceanobacillus chungangensis]|uniref:Zn-dependent protease n=2 Tax=Oceanobacillus chungangensis TaxID=1229152 RepID=A0A3D8PIG4_9BACI|nr:Zn-dependent protease [Oceanobacillus chungangensis]
MHPDTNQPFQIVNAHKLYNEFIDKASQEQQQEKIKELYENMIIEPVYDMCFEDGEYLYMVDFILNEAPSNFKNLEKLIEDIETENINEAIIDALNKSSKLLSTEIETTVCVFPTVEEDVPAMVNVGSGKIIALYNEFYSEEEFKASIAHEYHHSVWTEKFFQPEDTSTVLDNLVFEGKAVVFERLVYPESSYTIPIYPSYILVFWEMIEPDLYKEDLERSLEILIGSGNLPYLYGYSEGYKMVKSYLDKNPDLKPIEWLGRSADEIIEEGEYLSNYR